MLIQDIYCNFVAILRTANHINRFKQAIALLLFVVLTVGNGVPFFHNHDVDNIFETEQAPTITKGGTHCSICFAIESRFFADEPPLLNFSIANPLFIFAIRSNLYCDGYKSLHANLNVGRGPPSISAAS